jgi:hypothetical protein
VENARQFFIEKNRCAEQMQPVNNYRAGFGLSDLWNAGLNSTRQFVGDYSIAISPNGNVTIALDNITSMHSLSYHLLPSWARDPLGRS